MHRPYHRLLTFFFAITLMYASGVSSQTLSWRKLTTPSFIGRADDIYFINSYTGWSVNYTNNGGKIIKTTDGGWTWAIVFDSTVSSGTISFRSIGFLDSMNGFAGTLDSNRFLWHTTNGGYNWFVVQNVPQPPPKGICGLSVINSSVIYGCGTYYTTPDVIKSTDAGNTWVSINLSAYASALIDCYFTSRDSGIVVGGIGPDFGSRRAVILFTSNGGANWVTRITSIDSGTWGWKISFPNRNTGYVSLERIVGGPTYFFKTTNGGISWEQKLFLNSSYNEEAIGFYNDMLGWIGGEPNLSYETTDGGLTWSPMHFNPLGVDLLNRIRFINDTIGYASGRYVFKYSREESIGINENQNELPASFELKQNYPNPFNPYTVIKYKMAVQTMVKITIYDLLGREVYVFVNGMRPAGEYRFTWYGQDMNGNPVTSGLYFYKFESDEYTETKKMVLIR